MQKLGESPLRRVHAAAPLDRLQAFAVRCLGDLFSLAFCAVIAPQVVLAKRLQLSIHRNDRGTCGVERNGHNAIAWNSRFGKHLPHGSG